MFSRKTFNGLLCFMICLMVGACSQLAEAQSKDKIGRSEAPALNTLRRYVQLRLSNADWKEYSKYITWPDEPSWDCNWVVRHYTVGTARNEKEGVIIPVNYQRLGLFCYDFDFKANSSMVTVNYELIKDANGWKVNAPIPDYPDISSDTLLALLQISAKDLRESRERREQFSATAHRIAAALSLTRGK